MNPEGPVRLAIWKQGPETIHAMVLGPEPHRGSLNGPSEMYLGVCQNCGSVFGSFI